MLFLFSAPLFSLTDWVSLMVRVNRREVLSETDVQVVHCVNRCVRRGFLCGFLCGDDAVSGKNYDHRRVGIRKGIKRRHPY